MKKFHLRFSLLGFLILAFAPLTYGATTVPEASSNIRPVIDSADFIEVNKNILFDGSRSVDSENVGSARFLWEFGDRSGGSGLEITHTYEKPGQYTVALTVQFAGETKSIEKPIFVYTQAQTILVTKDYDQKELQTLITNLKEKSIFARIIVLDEKISQDDLNFIEKSTFVFSLAKPADLVVSKNPDLLKNKTLVIISNENLTTLERLSKNSFANIGAQKIILTNTDPLMPKDNTVRSIAETTNPTELIGILTDRKIAFIQVDTQERIGITNFMLAITNYLRQHGVPDLTLFLLLSIPFIATFITFCRQFIGIATLGIYTPMIFTVTFLIIGGVIGSATFIVIALTSVVLRRVMNKMRVMYVPKMALLLIGITLVMIGMFVLASVFNLESLLKVDIFPLILLLTMGERFISLQLERGFKAASFLFLETIIVALITYLLLEWQHVNILAYPEIVLLMIPLNYLIGKWTGLRLAEMLRFRELLDTAEQETEE